MPPRKPKPKKVGPPQPTQPWDVLWPEHRGATKGDENREALLAAVGFALSKWEELEVELAQTFSTLVGAQWGEPAVRAYGAIDNFRSRMNMLDAAADTFFYSRTWRAKTAADPLVSKTQDEYRELVKLCRNFAARRNDIAHGRYHDHPELGYFLRPAAYNSRKYDYEQPFGAYSYTSVEMGIYTQCFMNLTVRARAVRSALASIAKKIS
jgi:hypothetical protein